MRVGSQANILEKDRGQFWMRHTVFDVVKLDQLPTILASFVRLANCWVPIVIDGQFSRAQIGIKLKLG